MRPTAFIALGAITSAMALAGCAPSREQEEQPQEQPAEMAVESKLNDANVLAIMDAVSKGEVEAGKLAAQKGSDPDVRKFGQMLAAAHTELSTEVQQLAQKLGITPVLPEGNKMQEEHAEMMAELQEKTGTEFDEEFLDDQEEDHRELIEKVTNDLFPAIQSDEVRAFVHGRLPGMQGHLNVAQALQSKNKSASR